MTEQNDYFADDARQVQPSELIAFDVPIVSANARANELAEMLRFVQDAATFGVAPHIERVRYDSREGTCDISVRDAATLPQRVEHQLFGAARKHLARFTLCGSNELGEPLEPGNLRVQPSATTGYPNAANSDADTSAAIGSNVHNG
ncbi:hypothetical protein R6258_04330 [Halomonas sp. HP20-15]|uniref:hypothetical protein n=1 Tax=Halomonas sp. HP20-15 TaxID=3085901 RepID=UPI0029825A53|nr:hypothetical protein [Halomonas sp. HP20-15]MDW5376140.1 hypothetical protein [Halomonas sp. HP20-15]